MLNFITGAAGTGKTKYMREFILNKAKSVDEKIILIVPEQATFEYERQMLSFMGAKLMNTIYIFSFTRLAGFVFDKLGGVSEERLNEVGRNILMNLSLWEVRDQLDVYKSQIDKIEITDLILTALSEFKKCNISYKDLLHYSSIIDDKDLSQKLHEIAIIIESFEAMLERRYVDPLDDLTRLADRLKYINFFKDYTIFIDSFSSFSLQEFELLKTLIKQAKDVYISLCIDNKDSVNAYGLFSGTRQTMNVLKRLARDNDIKVSIKCNLEVPYRFKRNELKFLSENLYREKSSTWNKKVFNLSLYDAANQYDESQFVARNIKRLIFEEGYRFKDILVITRDMELYSGIIDIVFNSYDIPYFMDLKEKIDSRPLMNTVLTAFDIIIKRYKSEDIFKYLKNGLAGLSIEEIGILENYVLMWKIDGIQWLNEFEKHPRGYNEKFTSKDKILLNDINEMRSRVVEPLVEFSNKIKDASGFDMAKETYKFLISIASDKNLKAISEELEKNGKFNLAKEELRLWEILMEILNQIAISTVEKYIDEKQFAKLLKLAITSASMASIPETLDQVQIGVAGRSYSSEPKVTFVIGANEGDFPKVSMDTGLFSVSQRKKLIANGLDVYDHTEKTVLDERFVAYTTLSMASEQMYISFLSSDVQSNAKLPSSIVRQVKKIFPNIQILNEYCFDKSDLIWAVKPTFELMAKLWRTDSNTLRAIKEYFSVKNEYNNDLKKIELYSNKICFKFEQKQNSKNFFGSKIKLSASQIEKYYLCKFQYFCQYGLNIKKRKLAEIDALEYGSLMHYIFENMLKDHSIVYLSSINDEEIKIKVKEYLNLYVEQRLGGWEDKTSRFKFQFKRLVNTASILIRHMSVELSQSRFKPCGFELSIGDEGDIPPLILRLPDGEEAIIEGKVDRLDLMEKNGLNYVRIVDYKTGIKEFKLSDVLYGINIQMLLYMDAILKNGKDKYGNLVPAGILYMPANQPVIKSDRQQDLEKIKNMKMKKMRMNGLILDDPVVINGMEEGAKGIFIPASIKNGEVSKSESIASLALFGALLHKIDDLIFDMVRNLMDGNIEAIPKKGEYDSCKWCDYNSICGFEEGDPNLIIKKFKKIEVEKNLCIDGFRGDDNES